MIEESDGTIHHFDEITIYGGETTMKWDKHAKEPPAVWVETTGALLGITY